MIVTSPVGAEVTRGDTVELYCEAVGYPMLTELVWQLDGTVVPSEGPFVITSSVSSSGDGTYFRGVLRLVIASVQKAQSGVYTCSFVNAIGTTTSDAVSVTVLGECICSL